MELKRQTKKYLINRSKVKDFHDYFNTIADLDDHAKDGIYKVRSVYFDDDDYTALKDRIAQKDDRRKYRIRFYNDNPDYIKLEEKVKVGNIGTKTDIELTQEQVQKILDNDLEWMKGNDNELIQNFYKASTENNIKPKVIVQYIREPYSQPDKDTRFTMDYDIRATTDVSKFLDKELETDPLIEDESVIEIKWKHELPQEIVELLDRENLEPVNFSKYTSTYDYMKNHE